MPAWRVNQSWNGTLFESGYRGFAAKWAPAHIGVTDLGKVRNADCHSLSFRPLIEFAANNGLPVNFWSTEDVLYCSQASAQTPSGSVRTKEWDSMETFFEAISGRINCESLRRNTVMIPYSTPRVGDLLLSKTHVCLVAKVLQPGTGHPKASDSRIPDYPGAAVAARNVNELEYFREKRADAAGPAASASSSMHVDYLNHRGQGSPVKQRAEMVYFADPQELYNHDKLEVRTYAARTFKLYENFTPYGSPID